jgi:uncharacterized protein (TIGR02597 family)
MSRTFLSTVTAMLLGLAASAQVSTAPLGFMSYTLAQNTTTAIGMPLLADAVFAGANTGVTANTLTAAGAKWQVDQFAQPETPYLVAIMSGGQTGRLLRVIGNTADTLTIEAGTTNLTGDAATPTFAVSVNDRFEG